MIITQPVKQGRIAGFTLIEVMLVIVLIGFFATAISFTRFANQPEDQLEQTSGDFVKLFNFATEYGLLNNLALGLVIEENGYQFVGFDGATWAPLEQQKALLPKILPETLKLTLKLDDLPIEQNSFFSQSSLFENEQLSETSEEEEKPLIPQVLLLPGGDFTSFQLIFSYQEDFAQTLERNIEYHVLGAYTLPLLLKGPLYDGEEYVLE